MADATRSLKIVVEEEKKGDGYNQAANDIDQYGRKVSEADLRTKQWTENSKNLQAEISKSKVRIQELRQEVAKTGDTSLFGDIRKEEAKLRNFERTLKSLAPQVGTSFTSAIGDSLSGSLPKLMPVVIGAVVALAPILGAAIGGAVVGIGGLGGVAGGLFAASKDERVRAAASDLGKHISTSFFSSGASFVDPIMASVKILEKDFDQLDLGKTFQLASPFVTEFAAGIGGIATEFMPRFNRVLVDGKPAIDLFAQELPKIGTALGDLGVKLADSKGSIDGVNALFSLVTGTIEGTGSALAWLSDRYHDFNVTMVNVSGFLEKFDRLLGDSQGAAAARDDADAFARVSQGAEQAAIHFDTLSGAEKYNAAMALKLSAATFDAARQVKAMDDAVHNLFNTENSLADAHLAVAQGFLDLQKNLVKGKKNWSDNTDAGVANQKMLQAQIELIQRERDAQVASANGNKAAIDSANATYQTQLQRILAIGKAAGDSQAQLDKLAGEYDVNVVVNMVAGVQKGVADLGGLIAKALSAVGIKHKAAGGPVVAGQPYIVGEERPELFVPSTNGYIQPRVPAGGGAANPTVVISFAPTGNSLFDALLTELRKYIRVQGGNVQFALTG